MDIVCPNAGFEKKVQGYLDKGLDRRTAEYFARGRRCIVSVAANDDFTLDICFDNGEMRNLDCKPMFEIGTAFLPFRELANFRRVYLDDCHCVSWDIDPAVDSNVVWLNKIDLCPDSCYLDSIPITGGC